jgi:hypothetical protein
MTPENLNETERKLLEPTSLLERMEIILNAVQFEQDLQIKRRLELEEKRDELEDLIAEVESIEGSLDMIVDEIKSITCEIKVNQRDK